MTASDLFELPVFIVHTKCDKRITDLDNMFTVTWFPFVQKDYNYIINHKDNRG